MKHLGRSAPAPAGLIKTGPLVDVQLTLHQSLAKHVPSPPAPIVAKLMVDTGAERTCVADSVCKKLGLTPLRFTPVVGVSGKPDERPVYLMAIGMGMSPNPGEARAVAQTVWYHSEVIGVPDAKADVEYKGLLGRDFLAAFRLMYDGPTATYEIIDRRDELRKVAPESPVAENPNPSIKPHGGKKTQKAKTTRKTQRASRRRNRRKR